MCHKTIEDLPLSTIGVVLDRKTLTVTQALPAIGADGIKKVNVQHCLYNMVLVSTIVRRMDT